MKMNYFSFLRTAAKHIICEKCVNITQILFEISNSGLSIFWIHCYINLEFIGVHHAIEAVGFYNGLWVEQNIV